jgi:hypothetical protein
MTARSTARRPRPYERPLAAAPAGTYTEALASATMLAMPDDDSNETRLPFEMKLSTGPRPESRERGPEVDFDPATRRDIDELFRQIDLAQRDAEASSRDYYLT